ncbi:MAG: hypothetical protein ACRDQ5_15235, partial [Sciscionella sp.]
MLDVPALPAPAELSRLLQQVEVPVRSPFGERREVVLDGLAQLVTRIAERIGVAATSLAPTIEDAPACSAMAVQCSLELPYSSGLASGAEVTEQSTSNHALASLMSLNSALRLSATS